ncbi:hypothetical protein [Microcoleus sp. FACHB-68]|uniref:hypothetical protein n=1 Tax=Microcoleus sp. FACHB-68 TaxID=2692826 RepID=UPI0016844EFF|nr:hypothetical protein [Microcoleus sp. FACHB-68]MBD1936132.1 hypothetical protein [Microcoleus sp. FACHB-68]
MLTHQGKETVSRQRHTSTAIPAAIPKKYLVPAQCLNQFQASTPAYQRNAHSSPQ